MNDLGSKIKEIRQKNNLTQQEFSRLFNVSYQAVSKWENNINIPDIVILNEICQKFNLPLDELLNDKKTSKKWYIWSFIPVILLVIVIGMIVFYKPDNFEFKTISSNCDNFHISGSLAYNNFKSSIYISHIDYCGKEDDNVYQNISCVLYEENPTFKAKIDTCQSKENITLEKFL